MKMRPTWQCADARLHICRHSTLPFLWFNNSNNFEHLGELFHLRGESERTIGERPLSTNWWNVRCNRLLFSPQRRALFKSSRIVHAFYANAPVEAHNMEYLATEFDLVLAVAQEIVGPHVRSTSHSLCGTAASIANHLRIVIGSLVRLTCNCIPELKL